MKYVGLLGACCALLMPSLAVAADLDQIEARIHQLEQTNDLIWTITAGLILFLMQGGYLLYEAGLVRSKNSINVAQKNLADAFVSTTCYYLFGFGIMYGASYGGWFGWSSEHYSLTRLDTFTHTFFVYQLIFSGNVATIVSGATAERLRFGPYMVCTAFVSIIVYPVFGHWAWGDRLIHDNTPILASMGFIDFAGATVVCALGAWVSLAALLVIGPRAGRYDATGKPLQIQGHNIVLAVFGGFVLWLGAMAFNSGLAHAGSFAVSHVISNTILGGSFGGLACLVIGRIYEGIYRPERSLYGMLGGIVAVCAGCNIFSTNDTLIVSIFSGFICYFGHELITNRFKIDDAVSAIPVNGLCGIWGTIMIGPLMDAQHMPVGMDHWSLTLVQLKGVLASFVWGFGISYPFFWVMARFFHLRVTAHEEQIGLNTAEHGATLGTGMLQEALFDIVEGKHDLTRRLDDSTGDESAEIAHLFNKFVERIQYLMIDIAQNSKVLNTSSERLARVSSSFSASFETIFSESNQLSATTKNVNHQVEEAASIARSMSDDVNQMADSASAMSANLHDVSRSVAQITSSIQVIAGNASDVREVTTNARNYSGRASTAMRQLSQSTEKIEGVVDLIKEIAEQTNLLALNAIIESARAGEAGKGFAVVANEVKTLAEQTAHATTDITRRIEEMSRDTRDVEQVIVDITALIEMITSAVGGISESVTAQSRDTQQMANVIGQTSSQAEAMAGRVGAVANGARNVYDNMHQAAQQLARVLASVEQFTHQTKSNQVSADNVKKTSGDLSRIADQLVRTVEEYKV